MFAQLIGRDLTAMRHTVSELSQFPIAGIDLNLGCPAPVVCRKDAGGGLLRDLEFLNRLIGTLRDSISGSFTLKTRIGYDSPEEFSKLLAIFRAHAIDGLTIHARTVQERYRTPVHLGPVAQAVEEMPCPVIGNGNVVDIDTAQSFIRETHAAGLMIGRGAIRNPWIFTQLISAYEGQPIVRPTLRDVLEYVEELYEEIAKESPKFNTKGHVQRMKRSISYVSHGIDKEFEYQLRRANLPEEFHSICRTYLDRSELLPSQPPKDSKLFCGFEALTTTSPRG